MQDAFWIFITKIGLYPTVIFTGLVMFVVLYWVVSLLGMTDMESVDLGDVGGDIGDVGGDIGDVSSNNNMGDLGIELGSEISSDATSTSTTGLFTALLLKFGLYGVPLIIILTLISLIGWVLSYIYTSFLHERLQPGFLYYLFGTGALILVLVVSMWLTGLIIAPIRKNIAKIPKRNAANNLGKVATIRTLTVTDTHGEAELNDGGAGLILKVRPLENTNDKPLTQGDEVILVDYVKEANIYHVRHVK